ncbi:MAG: hypothetical protein HY566_01715 [Candidatus Kerfeldbacteria bacterium]|nr:hypothetical protein [Candidatus Kerfeldbacteria bacterium]
MAKERKIFFVVATGGQDTDRHYHDTIKTRRTLDEVRPFLSEKEVAELKRIYHGQPFAVWGTVPGPRNIPFWAKMEAGDYLLIYREKKIILAAEVAMKTHNPKLANFFWRTDSGGKTWEYMYFLINDVAVDVQQSAFNGYFEYSATYHPQGFMAIDQQKVNAVLSTYGDLLSLLHRIEKGEKLEEIEVDRRKMLDTAIEEKVERAPTEHDEMQWRLIRLGNKAHFDVWVPRGDQGRVYQGQRFGDLVIREFHEAIDVPSYIKNIDTVWKLGLSIKSAFEIEHSTSIYSGILRLSDLRSLAPNGDYPLFIVANRDRRAKVFEQLKRPTFSNKYLALDRVMKFLSYDKVRELDESFKNGNFGFEIGWLTEQAEALG